MSYAILAAAQGGPTPREEFYALNDRVWGPGNWIECPTCPPDAFGNLTFHHRNFHNG